MGEGILGARPAGRDLLAAGPDDPEAHAARWLGWLGWLAYRMDGRPELDWWVIPAWVPGGQLRLVRRVVAGAVLAASAGLAAVMDPLAATLPGIALLLAFVARAQQAQHDRGPRRPRFPQPRPPRTFVPRWPPRGELGWLAFFLVVVWPFPAMVFRTWQVLALGPPGATYRADRRTTAGDSLAWMLGTAAVGLLGAAFGGGGYGWWLGAMVPLVLGAGLFFGLFGSGYSLVKLTELVLWVQWRERVCFGRLLTEATVTGALQVDGPGYRFADPALQLRLAERHAGVLAERAAVRARQAARPGVRAWLAAFLTRDRISRIGLDAGIGLMAALVAAANPAGWGNRFGLAVVGLIVVALGWIAVTSLLRGVARAASWTLANVTGLRGRPRAAAVAAAMLAAAVAVATAGTVLLTVVAAALPVAFVIACGAWAAVLTWRRLHAARRPWLRRWLRWAPDALAAATICASVLVLVDRSQLTAQPVAGVLFPPAVWGSVRLWRAMQGSRRLLVRAAADITLSLLLGAEAVLFLVWLANLLGLSRPEVVALRALLHQAGSAADVPAWVWAGLYGFLAALAVAFVLWPPRLAKVMGWLRRLRAVLLATAARRTLTVVHIGLMVAVLVGWATPAALTATFRRQLPAVYAVAVQRDLVSEGEIAAYRQIRQTFTATQSPALASLVADIHDTSGAPAGADSATTVEADLARRLGELQAVALGLEARAARQAAAEAGQAGEAAAKQAGLGAPVHGEAGLDGRLGQVEGEQSADDDAAKRAELAGDLAAATIASTISIPHLSDGEIVQVVREYLSGLIEGSPLKDVFAAWARRLPGSEPPPGAEAMVVPQADPLEHAAATELSAAFTGQGLADPVTDPHAHDPAVARALRETALAAAVDMVNQARYLQRSSGPCAGCTRPEKPDDSQVQPPEEDGGGGE